MNTEKYIELYIKEYSKILKSCTQGISEITSLIFKCWLDGTTIYTCGNGGSTGLLMNTTTDLLLHPFTSESKTEPVFFANRLKIFDLAASHSTISGIANDLGFQHVYSEQLKAIGQSNSLLFAVSGSGNSPNIYNALEIARSMGMKTLLITRNTKAKGLALADYSLVVDGPPSKFPGQTGGNNNNFYFEDLVVQLTHIVCGLLKQKVMESINDSNKA